MTEFKIGAKIKFVEEKQRYTIVAKNDNFLICTKPFNLRKTYLYTIVDLREMKRGPDYWILGKFDYKVPEECVEALKELDTGETQLSRRNSIPLKIERVDHV